MPKSAPEKVATSPKPMSRDESICPLGAMKMPQNRSMSPPRLMMAAVMSCNVGFISVDF